MQDLHIVVYYFLSKIFICISDIHRCPFHRRPLIRVSWGLAVVKLQAAAATLPLTSASLCLPSSLCCRLMPLCLQSNTSLYRIMAGLQPGNLRRMPFIYALNASFAWLMLICNISISAKTLMDFKRE